MYKKPLIKTIKLINYLGSGASLRLVKWTGKAPQYIHPKHLLKKPPEYLKYFDKNDVVLDIGCYAGQRDFKLAPNVKKIVAFDYNDRHLAMAEEWRKKYGITNIEFRKLSAENPLPFENESFDKILFLDVLEHLFNREQIMKECFRVLKPGRKMILAVPNSETSWKKFQKSAGMNYFSDPDHKVEYTKEEIIKKHEDAGFTVLKVLPVVFDFPLAGIIDIVGGFSIKAYEKLSEWKQKKAVEKPEESIGFMVISGRRQETRLR